MRDAKISDPFPVSTAGEIPLDDPFDKSNSANAAQPSLEQALLGSGNSKGTRSIRTVQMPTSPSAGRHSVNREACESCFSGGVWELDGITGDGLVAYRT